MIKSVVVLLMACAPLLDAGIAAAEKIDFDQGVDVKGVIETIQAKVATETAADKAATANWTIMVYINAKNNLEEFGLKDVNEMEMVGSSSKVKIAVELGRIDGYDDSDGDWKGQRRYIVQKDADAAKITSPILQEIPKADMGDWKHLVEFVKWAQKEAPAQRTMLIVWNHGSGWDKRRNGNVWLRGISYDDETGNNISTPGLGQALSQMGKIDVYASDACLMQMPEVGYQIKDYTDFIVGSEETEPGDGYTYDTFLGPLAAKPTMLAKDVAKLTAEAFTAHYAQQGEGATQSAVKSAALTGLRTLLDDWTKLVMAAGEGAVVKTARDQAQNFAVSDNRDLLHLVKLVGAATKNPGVKGKGAELEKFITDELVSTNAVYGNDYKNAHGIAIYLPSYGYNKDYDELAWSKEGNWGKFIQWLK